MFIFMFKLLLSFRVLLNNIMNWIKLVNCYIFLMWRRREFCGGFWVFFELILGSVCLCVVGIVWLVCCFFCCVSCGLWCKWLREVIGWVLKGMVFWNLVVVYGLGECCCELVCCEFVVGLIFWDGEILMFFIRWEVMCVSGLKDVIWNWVLLNFILGIFLVELSVLFSFNLCS